MANNLVDLKLLNTAYGINKKRIDNLSKKVITNTLEVGTTTVTGTAKVTGGTLTTDTLSVTGELSVDGSMVVAPEKALTLNNGGTVNGATTLDSLTGSIKLGNAFDTNGYATGSARVVVPNGKTLTLNGTATASDLSLGGSATIESSTLKDMTIQNGTVNLNNNTLTVTSDSTITNTIGGSTVTLTGVGAIDAKSMTLTTTDGASLNIDNKLGELDPLSGTAVACNGGISASKVYNAVWNDLADSIEVPQDTELEYGYCYKYKNGKVYKTDEYADSNVLGIHSDTAGMVLGIKPSHIKCINLAVAGVVLAYVDEEYECGTPLVATKEGKLTKANKMTRVLHPERIIATYFKKETNDLWGPSSNKIAVNGRSWVKVK